MINKEIINELKMEGATDSELSQLNLMMDKLQSVSKIERSFKHKRTFLEPVETVKQYKKLFTLKWLLVPSIAFLFLLLIGGVSVIRAQSSLPGESLYLVKILSEKAYSLIDPKFKDEIIVRRSEEIKKLTEEKKDPARVGETIKDYQIEVKKEHSIEKIKESQENLESAKEHAAVENRKEIEKVLSPEKREENWDVKASQDKQDTNPQDKEKERTHSESREN